VGHGLDRAPAPAGNPRHVIAQRRRFDHLQPLAHPPPQIGPPQLLLDLGALLWGDYDALCTHALAPLLCLPRTPASPRRWVAYHLPDEFTSEYLARIIHEDRE
jgi:hypothetical protein